MDTNSKKIPCGEIEEPATLSDIFSKARFHPIAKDWYGNPPAANSLSFYFATTPATIIFASRVTGPARFDSTERLGEYREGLWRHDAAEFFLAEEGESNRYQEFNLSPSGSWWSCSFLRCAAARPAALQSSAWRAYMGGS